jgi:hypothetical protein
MAERLMVLEEVVVGQPRYGSMALDVVSLVLAVDQQTVATRMDMAEMLGTTEPTVAVHRVRKAAVEARITAAVVPAELPMEMAAQLPEVLALEWLEVALEPVTMILGLVVVDMAAVVVVVGMTLIVHMARAVVAAVHATFSAELAHRRELMAAPVVQTSDQVPTEKLH